MSRTLADIEIDGTAECFHCEEPLPMTSKVHVGDTVVAVQCPACGCTTPFRIVPEEQEHD